MISVPCYEVSFLTLCAEASGLQPRTQLGNLHGLKRRHSMARLEVPLLLRISDDQHYRGQTANGAFFLDGISLL
eukprot:COSAG01_NODE_4715_length_4796_cov_2.941665_3_plen_74_part_00